MRFLDILNGNADPGQNTLSEWDIAIRQARGANLLSRLAAILRASHQLEKLPDRVKPHLYSSLKQSDRQHIQVIWEVSLLAKQLGEINVKPVLLKGGAYHYQASSASQGRTLTDIDILIRKEDLTRVERHLFTYGWIRSKLDDYDQKYYREYTHEIPPLTNIYSSTTLDVHHNIFPVLRGLQPEAELLWNNAIFDDRGIGVLHPYDQIIHSATHLFWEGEFENGLRDLTDIDLLLKELVSSDDFCWQFLIERAIKIRLLIPLLYAGRYCNMLLNTPVPEDIVNLQFARHYPQQQIPSFFKLLIMDFLFRHALKPHHSSCRKPGDKLALFILFLRGHFLKMPLNVLIPHILKKVFSGRKNKGSGKQGN